LRNRLTRLFIALTCVSLIAAACGGDDGGGGAATDTSEQRGQNESPVINPGEPSQGGTMRWSSIGDTDYMDPGQAYTVTFFTYIARGTLRTLTTFAGDTTDFAEQSTVTPDLAESLGEPNEDNTEWTYTIKDGVTFGPAIGGKDIPGVTGEQITSADIKYGVERLFLPSVGAGYSTYYEDIEGVKEFQAGKADEITGIETPDDKTIIFHLTQPLGDWDFRMAMPAVTAVPEKVAAPFDKTKDSDYDSSVVASGPYYVDSYTPGEEVIMKRNEEWDPATDENRKAYVDEIDWKQGFDNNVCVQKVIDNDYDTAVDCEPEGALLKEIATDPELKARFFNLPIACTSYLFINTTVEPFTDPKVREALNFAVDKEQQLKVLGGPFVGDVAGSILPPGMQGYLPISDYDPFDSADPVGDPDKAKELLKGTAAEGGWDKELLLVGDASGAGPKQIESLRADLQAIGFSNFEVKTLNYPDYYTQYYQVPDTNTPLGFSAWCEDYPSPVTFLKPLLYGPNILPQGNSNYSELDDPEVNAAIEEAEKSVGEEAVGLWEEANKLATESAAWVPLRWYLDRDVGSENLVNGYWNQYYSGIDWVNIGVQ
jgi:peptide/nickel transport system substrate-binding protein